MEGEGEIRTTPERQPVKPDGQTQKGNPFDVFAISRKARARHGLPPPTLTAPKPPPGK